MVEFSLHLPDGTLDGGIVDGFGVGFLLCKKIKHKLIYLNSVWSYVEIKKEGYKKRKVLSFWVN